MSRWNRIAFLRPDDSVLAVWSARTFWGFFLVECGCAFFAGTMAGLLLQHFAGVLK